MFWPEGFKLKRNLDRGEPCQEMTTERVAVLMALAFDMGPLGVKNAGDA